jgi:hypothetical protein
MFEPETGSYQTSFQHLSIYWKQVDFQKFKDEVALLTSRRLTRPVEHRNSAIGLCGGKWPTFSQQAGAPTAEKFNHREGNQQSHIGWRTKEGRNSRPKGGAENRAEIPTLPKHREEWGTQNRKPSEKDSPPAVDFFVLH